MPGPSSPSSVSPITAVLDDFVRDGRIRGGVLAMTNGDGTDQLHAFGTVHVGAQERPAWATDRYLLTSITKTLTAMQVLRLVEDGLITLYTPLAELVPEFAANGKQAVLVHHALTHTTGLDDTRANTAEGTATGMKPTEHLAAACDAPLSDPPGSRVSYCSPPFWVLAEMVERLTGMRYVEHLERTLAAPLGMVDTGYNPASEPPSDLVDAHIGPTEHRHLAEQVRRLSYPAGGVLSTASDLLRYGRLLLRGGLSDDDSRVIAPATVAALSRPWTSGLPGERTYEPCPWPTERGLGWALGGPGDLPSRRTLWHSGGSGTAMWVDQDHDVVVVLLTATWFLDAAVFARIVNAAYRSRS